MNATLIPRSCTIMRILKALLLPFLLILSLIGVDKLHGLRPSPTAMMQVHAP